MLISIEHDNIELMQLLLSSPNVEIGDSLLHAINEENVEAVRLLLDYMQQHHQNRKDLSVSESEQFLDIIIKIYNTHFIVIMIVFIYRS